MAGPLDRPAGIQPPKAFSADPAVTDKEGVAVHEKAFALLERSATYGQEARSPIEAELSAL
ncbi:hypothetical protein ABZU45_02210 [Streptomyces avermitilis]|uniref:hypothetical protein n=1 Tax=Streptomyces avermitilis TaxID=33903 RepID=UPI0033B4D5E0